MREYLDKEGFKRIRSMDEVKDLTCKTFEYFSKWLLSEFGYEKVWVSKKKGKYQSDGGVDIKAEQNGFCVVGQCKNLERGRGGYMPIEHVRALGGSMKERNVNNGVFVSTLPFGKAAKECAKKLNIRLIGPSEIMRVLPYQ